MASVTVSPSPYAMALVTRSLVSRIAMSGSTGTCQAWRAARTRPRASAAEDGSLASRTRRWYSSAWLPRSTSVEDGYSVRNSPVDDGQAWSPPFGIEHLFQGALHRQALKARRRTVQDGIPDDRPRGKDHGKVTFGGSGPTAPDSFECRAQRGQKVVATRRRVQVFDAHRGRAVYAKVTSVRTKME